MSLISSNGVGIESISIKGLHNRSIELLKSFSEGRIQSVVMVCFIERRENNKGILKSMNVFIPRSIMDNPELTDENIQVMKEYLYHKFVDIGIPLKNLDVMSDPIKEKDYIL